MGKASQSIPKQSSKTPSKAFAFHGSGWTAYELMRNLKIKKNKYAQDSKKQVIDSSFLWKKEERKKNHF